jgi:hypothetical protein
MRPTLLQQHDITIEELRERYAALGSYRALADELGCSRVTLQRYLNDQPKHRPWRNRHLGYNHPNRDYWRKKFRDESLAKLEATLLDTEFWYDVRGRAVPRAAIETLYVEEPCRIQPVIILRATLRGTHETAILLFRPELPWLTGRGALTSSSATHQTPHPSPSDQSHPSPSYTAPHPE